MPHGVRPPGSDAGRGSHPQRVPQENPQESSSAHKGSVYSMFIMKLGVLNHKVKTPIFRQFLITDSCKRISIASPVSVTMLLVNFATYTVDCNVKSVVETSSQ